MRLPRSPSTRRNLLLALLTILLLLLIAVITGASAPQISTMFEGATIEIAADKAWSILPGDCIDIHWELEGIKSLYVDGEGQIGRGELSYCPAVDASSPEFEVAAPNGEVQIFTLETYFLPPELLLCVAFVTTILAIVLAAYYLITFQLDKPPPVRWTTGVIFISAVIVCLLAVVIRVFSIPETLQGIGEIFSRPSWQLFGLVLASSVFIPVLVQKVSRGIKTRSFADLAAVAAFLLFLFLLCMPFGFDSIAQFEAWIVNAYFEERPSKIDIELITRFWELVPHTLAYLISSESFIGYHVVHFLMFWGKLSLLYGILRHLRTPRVYAFLITILFMVYPVNDSLMSLRSLPMQFSMFALLTAVYLTLEQLKNPSRLRLLGTWLALIFNVASNESAYILILVIPLWWMRSRQRTWREWNLTVIWYLFPAAKLTYLVMLLAAEQRFYFSEVVDGFRVSANAVIDWLGSVFSEIVVVYQHTVVDAWLNTIGAISNSAWLLWSLLMLALVAGAAAYLARSPDDGGLPTLDASRKMVIAGALLIMPAVGVLILFERYRGDTWRMYFYVPIFAAIAVAGLVFLVTKGLRTSAHRKIAIITILIILIFPCLNRLLLQHQHFRDIAGLKAKALTQIVEQAPAWIQGARVMMITDISLDELQARNFSGFRYSMFDSALHVLYGIARPRVAFLCIVGDRCSTDDIDIVHNYLGDVKDFSDVVVFRLHEDLSVELLRDLPEELRDQQIENYNPDRLIDSSAPLPPRAITMLGAALHTQ